MTKECQHCHRQVRYCVFVTDFDTIDEYDEGLPKRFVRERWCLTCVYKQGYVDAYNEFEKSLSQTRNIEDFLKIVGDNQTKPYDS